MNEQAAHVLDGVTVVTTRDQPGQLDELLENAGATVVHVPLIKIVDPIDSEPISRALSEFATFDWAAVTSRHGAARIAPAAAEHRHVKLAAVGTATSRTLSQLAGRSADLTPSRQTGADLGDLMAPHVRGRRVLIAQADRAGRDLFSRLVSAGALVTEATAYRTQLLQPSADDRNRMLAANVVAFASGSAARAWSQAMGPQTPATVVAIGPTTAATAREVGLQVTHIAADHSVAGLFDEIVAAALL